MDRIDRFIARLYQSVEACDAAYFRDQALDGIGELIAFDGALWGSGDYTSNVFHSVVTRGLAAGYPAALERSLALNPMLPALRANLGHAVDMRNLIDDGTFHDSPVYRQCFARYGVERILSYLGNAPHSGVYTLISLYRFSVEPVFSERERRLFERLAFHLVAAATHAFYVHVSMHSAATRGAVRSAVCDSHGLLYQAEPGFFDLLARLPCAARIDRLPFDLPRTGERICHAGLCVEVSPLGDLFSVRLWRERAIDSLDARDREIVDGVCRGMTFKDIARQLDLAPSTVSNRLYRVYRELGINSRSTLVHMIHDER